MKTPIHFETTFNRYEASAILGEGGAGIVYEVSDQDQNILALKCLIPSRVTQERVKRFRNEIAFCQRTNHDNILTVIDHGFRDHQGVKCPFYVMQRYKGTLRLLMQSGIPNDRVLPIFSQLLDGIEGAHLQQVWHRDLKPENILYDDDRDYFVIADFGIAHFREDLLITSVKTKPTSRLANFQYSAPEQRASGGRVDHRADIYSLGLILNEMFTGEVIQGAGFRTIGAVELAYSYLDDLIENMVQQNPSARPNSIDEIKKELIAHKNEFVSRQKISELKNAVVPKASTDDVLINDPVRIVGFDYVNGQLIFGLNHGVPLEWVEVFRGIQYRTALLGKTPEYFGFNGSRASIEADERDAQQVTDDFKRFIQLANDDYRRRLEREAAEQEKREKERLQAELREEEKRQRVLADLKL